MGVPFKCKFHKNIISDCSTYKPKAVAKRAYVFNRNDIEIVKVNNLISSITNLGTSIGFALDVQKVGMIDYVSDVVISDNLPDYYTHFVKFPVFENDSESLLNIDSAENLIIVIETNTGQFFAFGVDSGLYQSVNVDNETAKDIEFKSEFEKFSMYEVLNVDTLTTKTMLENLLYIPTPPIHIQVLEFETDSNAGLYLNGKLEVTNNVNTDVFNIDSVALFSVAIVPSIITSFCVDNAKPLTKVQFDCNVLNIFYGENGGILLDYVKFNTSSDANNAIYQTIEYLDLYGNQTGGQMIINSPNVYPNTPAQSSLQSKGWSFNMS